MPLCSLRTLLVAGFLVSLPMAVPAIAADAPVEDPVKAAAAAEQTKADLDIIAAFLAKEHPKVQDAKPFRVDTEAIRTAYPGLRFYVIKMSIPVGGQPPPYVDPETIIDVTLSIDAKGKVEPRTSIASWNSGLMKIASDEDAKTAAAAIMSLMISSDGLSSVPVAKVQLQVKDKNRICTYKATW
ncbi:MAG TPA: hypothetical protein VL860_04685, partial [Planctomycetota bacterium]|nr:hypothetical protein [Planctomycetota bacterium]